LIEKRHPDWPWLTAASIQILSSWLRPTDIGFEWGSGRSTLWFARRIRKLISVEHDPKWYNKISHVLREDNITNVEYYLMECDEQVEDPVHSPYVKIVDNFADFSFDFVLVDGILRAHCTLAALPKIRPGGILIIDNANRYFPSNSVSPGSRKPTEGPASEEWAIVAKRLEDWRCIWTTNGVTDTALYLKPCDPARNL